MSCVYFLVNNGPDARFKIGKSASLVSRILALGGPDAFDLERSIAFYTPNPTQAERALHSIFHNSRVTLPNKRDGHTEWYDLQVMPDALAFVRQYGKSLGITTIERSLTSHFTKVRGEHPQVVKKKPKQRVHPEDDQDMIAEWANTVDLYIKTLKSHISEGLVLGYLRVDEAYGEREYLLVREKEIVLKEGPNSTCTVSDSLHSTGNLRLNRPGFSLLSHTHASGMRFGSNKISILDTDVSDRNAFKNLPTFQAAFDRIRSVYIQYVPGYDQVPMDRNVILEAATQFTQLIQEREPNLAANLFGINKYIKISNALLREGNKYLNPHNPEPFAL